ncbi:MAG TPA: DUF167 domain-containing protein [bacterium]|nr:DUF167 domain-containing protein [bacterium]
MAKLEVEVAPRSRKPGVVGRRGGALRVRVASPPEGGRANKELVALVARFLGVRRGAVSVVRGATSRRKLLEVEGLAEDELAAALARAPGAEG